MYGWAFILICVGLLLRHSKERVLIHVSERQIQLNTSSILVSCDAILESSELSNKVVLEFQPNKMKGWVPIVKVNESGMFQIHHLEANRSEAYRLADNVCDFHTLECMFDARVYLNLKKCPDEHNGLPSFRCQTSNEYETANYSEEIELQITGQPTYIGPPSIVNPLNPKIFTVGDLLQLQCTGKEDYRAKSENIRWCKSVSGQYVVISLQENHQTHDISQSEDGCTFVQKSEIFYHITNEDNDLEIMCELGYNKSNKMCGNGRFNSTIHIPIETQGFDIMCQISSSSKCGNGVISNSILLQINLKEVPGSGSSDTWLTVSVIVSVLLIAILLSEVILLILAHRRGGLVLLGILITFKSKTATALKKEENHIKPDHDREISFNLRAGPMYEELNLSGIQVEKYEALELK